jgi:hypothetical protein
MVVRGRTRRGVKAWALLKGGAAFLLENVLGGGRRNGLVAASPVVRPVDLRGTRVEGVSTAGDVGWRGIESSSSSSSSSSSQIELGAGLGRRLMLLPAMGVPRDDRMNTWRRGCGSLEVGAENTQNAHGRGSGGSKESQQRTHDTLRPTPLHANRTNTDRPLLTPAFLPGRTLLQSPSLITAVRLTAPPVCLRCLYCSLTNLQNGPGHPYS